jgi:hypothetical protein
MTTTTRTVDSLLPGKCQVFVPTTISHALLSTEPPIRLSLSAREAAKTGHVRTQPPSFGEGRLVNEWTTGQGKRLAVRGASQFGGGGIALGCNRWLETNM